MKALLHALLGIFLIGATFGCSQLKPDPAPDSGFLDNPGELKPEPGLSGRWISEKYRANRENYKHVIIAPINTRYLQNTASWSHVKTKSEEEIRKDAQEIAQYIEQEFKKPFQDGRIKRLNITDHPGPDTLLYEIALTELVPTDVVRNAAGNVAGFFVPGGGLVSTGAGGSIALEMRISDSQTGEVLMKIKDRLTDQIAPVDLAGLTPYRHAKKNVNVWVGELVEAVNNPHLVEIAAVNPITLSPW